MWPTYSFCDTVASQASRSLCTSVDAARLLELLTFQPTLLSEVAPGWNVSRRPGPGPRR